MKQVIIDKPCSEKLDKISGQEKNFYCGSCRHNVPDLSKSSTEEVRSFVTANPASCAIFHLRHVEMHEPRFQWINKAENFFIRLRLKRVAVVSTIFLLFLSSCSRRRKTVYSAFRKIPVQEIMHEESK
jgi:hypothetical protein